MGDEVPESVEIHIWNKNKSRFHADAFCGSVTFPCSPEMECLSKQNFTLEKRSKVTGEICISLSVRGATSSMLRTPTFVGGELDEVLESITPSSSSRRRSCLALTREQLPIEAVPLDEADGDDSADEFPIAMC